MEWTHDQLNFLSRFETLINQRFGGGRDRFVVKAKVSNPHHRKVIYVLLKHHQLRSASAVIKEVVEFQGKTKYRRGSWGEHSPEDGDRQTTRVKSKLILVEVPPSPPEDGPSSAGWIPNPVPLSELRPFFYPFEFEPKWVRHPGTLKTYLDSHDWINYAKDRGQTIFKDPDGAIHRVKRNLVASLKTYL
jgi:hypothetical protein